MNKINNADFKNKLASYYKKIGNLLLIHDKYLFIEENKQYYYTNKNGLVLNEEEGKFNKIKKVIFSDSALELKVIKVPIVAQHLLKSIVLNTVKKYSTVMPTDNNIDYKILTKIENQYEILVFIRHFEGIDFSQKRIYSLYHIFERLAKDKDFPDDSSFLINRGNIWFLYSFKDRIFKKRSIYYKEDIKKLKKDNIYHFDLLSDYSKYNKDFIKIPIEKQKSACFLLNNRIFKENILNKPKKMVAIAFASVFFLVLVILELYSFNLDMKKKAKIAEKQFYDKEYQVEKTKRGVNDKIFDEYKKLYSKKSNIDDFFYYLYLVGKGNIKIKSLDFNYDKVITFSISGECKDDSLFESLLKESKKFKDINFNIKRDNTKINFSIKGEVINE